MATDNYGEVTMNLFAVFAKFETKLRKERQKEGIPRKLWIGRASVYRILNVSE